MPRKGIPFSGWNIFCLSPCATWEHPESLISRCNSCWVRRYSHLKSDIFFKNVNPRFIFLKSLCAISTRRGREFHFPTPMFFVFLDALPESITNLEYLSPTHSEKKVRAVQSDLFFFAKKKQITRKSVTFLSVKVEPRYSRFLMLSARALWKKRPKNIWIYDSPPQSVLIANSNFKNEKCDQFLSGKNSWLQKAVTLRPQRVTHGDSRFGMLSASTNT